MKAKVTYTSPGGETLDIEFENGATVADIVAAAGQLVGGKFALNGEPCDADEPVEADDVISQSKTAEGA